MLDFPAELHLSLNLVAVRNGNASHIIANSENSCLSAFKYTYSRAHPGCDFLAESLIFPMTCNNLAFSTHTCADVAVLAVAVGTLIEIHKVHINGIPGNVTVELSIKVKIGLHHFRNARDPHF